MERVTVGSTIGQIIVACGIVFGIILGIIGDEDFEGDPAPFLMFGFFASGAIAFTLAFWSRQRYLDVSSIVFRIERQPLIPTASATDGVPAAIEGTFRADSLLNSPYTKTPCVYYHSIKEKYVKNDKSSHWKIVENVHDYVPFWIEDKFGRVQVRLDNVDADFSNYGIEKKKTHGSDYPNSEVDCEKMLFQKEYSKGGGLLGIGSARYRKTEYALKPDVSGFVYGFAAKKEKNIAIIEAKNVPLIVSFKSKDDYAKQFHEGEGLIYWSNAIMAAGFALSYLIIRDFLHLPAYGILVGITIILFQTPINAYNRMVELSQRALNASSEIDIQTTRRASLVPEVEKAVKAIAGHEKQLHALVATMRQNAKPTSAQSALTSEFARADLQFLAIAESYPRIKTNENFKALMVTLTDTENRIAHTRAFYNRSVLKYNTLIQQVPFTLIAQPLGFAPKQYLSFE